MEEGKFIYEVKTIVVKYKSDVEIDKAIYNTSAKLYNFLKSIYNKLDDDQEHFTLISLNNQLNIVGYKVLFSGGQDNAQVDLKLIFRYALLLGARFIAVAHNHPNGSLEPSEADISLTKRIQEAGVLLDLPLIDHIIINNNGYISLADKGIIK